ncbi:MAG: discoidin domain-containing protein, partial [Ignavibacteriaceae bacterium]|nr:discoidin domain-containing protein [Ignavibacteriaceae bacterium]
FKRIPLEVGETKTVTFQISPNELYYYDEAAQSYTVAPGLYAMQVGPSSDNLPMQGTFELTTATPTPDLQIANIRTVPAYPLKGEKVQFLATIINRGTGATPSDQPLEVLFKVNGKEISKFSEITDAIPAGGMKLINGTIAADSSYTWTADQIANFTVEVEVNYLRTITERNTSNNKKSASFKVYEAPPKSIALRKTVTVSSIEKAGLEGDKAVDGNYGTRWSSQFSDPQTITIDLGSVQEFNQIKLFWEAAYGKEYKIQISNDASSWIDLIHQTNSYGGIEKYDVQASARYLRIYGIKRGTVYGYSLYEVEVFNLNPVEIKEEQQIKLPTEFYLGNNYPNPFNPETVISYQLSVFSKVTLKVFDVLGKEITTLVNEEQSAGKYSVKFETTNNTQLTTNTLPSGVYFYQLQAGNFIEAKKMILLR